MASLTRASITPGLQGQHAIVTGSGTGIGRAIAQALHSLGANVSIADLNGNAALTVAADLSHVGPTCLGLQLDVSEATSVAAGVAMAIDHWGRIDILINNAGTSGESAPVWEATDANWAHVLAVNLTGTFHMCRAVLPSMRKRGYGRIVNVSSISARDGNANAAAYSASKAGILGLTRALSLEVADAGILVNAVSPAAVDTERALAADQASRAPLIDKIPMGRAARPEEVADLVLFLASPACAFSTGANFDISGGRANIT